MADKPKRKIANSPYLKYSSMGFQLIAVIVIGVVAGKYLDRKFNPENPPYFTVALILLLLTGYLYNMIREITSNKNE